MRVDTAQNDGASICPRSRSAASHSFASNPRLAPLVAFPPAFAFPVRPGLPTTHPPLARSCQIGQLQTKEYPEIVPRINPESAGSISAR